MLDYLDQTAIASAAQQLLQETNGSLPLACQLATQRLFLYHSKGQGHGPEFWHQVYNRLLGLPPAFSSAPGLPKSKKRNRPGVSPDL